MSTVHPLGGAFGLDTERCGSCAWARLAGPGPKVLRCVASGNQRIHSAWQACQFWEAKLDCLTCAACCGPAFDAVEVGARDPVRRLHPDKIVRQDGRYQVPRTVDNHCINLNRHNHNKCDIYEDRPQCCRDFEQGSANCIFARRRLGLSPSWRIS